MVEPIASPAHRNSTRFYQKWQAKQNSPNGEFNGIWVNPTIFFTIPKDYIVIVEVPLFPFEVATQVKGPFRQNSPPHHVESRVTSYDGIICFVHGIMQRSTD